MSFLKLKTTVPKELGCVTVSRIIPENGDKILEDSVIFLVDTDEGLHWVWCPMGGIIRELPLSVGERMDGEAIEVLVFENDTGLTSGEISFHYEACDETVEEIEETIRLERDTITTKERRIQLSDPNYHDPELEAVLSHIRDQNKPEKRNSIINSLMVLVLGGLLSSFAAYLPKVLFGSMDSFLWVLVPLFALSIVASMEREVPFKIILSTIVVMCFFVNPIRGAEDHLPRWAKASDVLTQRMKDVDAELTAWDEMKMSPKQIQNGVQITSNEWDKKATTKSLAVLVFQVKNDTNTIIRSLEIDPMSEGNWRFFNFDPPLYPGEVKELSVKVPLARDGKPRETQGRAIEKRWNRKGPFHRNVDTLPFKRTAVFAQEARSWIFEK